LKISDDGKVDKEPKCWFNTRIGLVLERSFKFPMEVNPEVARAGLENEVLWMMILRIAVMGEGAKWISTYSGSRCLQRIYVFSSCST
jgi:hypothetical protein